MKTIGFAIFVLCISIGLEVKAGFWEDVEKILLEEDDSDLFGVPVFDCSQVTGFSRTLCKAYSEGICIKYHSEKTFEKLRNMCIEKSLIYENCVIEKSQDASKSAMREVRSVCNYISENPSLFQRLRWGN